MSLGLDLPRALAGAVEIAEEADQLSLAHFQAGVAAVAKPDGSPVTVADREVERLVRRRLSETFPGHAVMGEEEGGSLDPAVPTWVLDPIDATKNFIRGIPVWATLLALCVEGQPVVGVASAPAMGERWEAAAGLGAHCNGEPLHVSAVDALSDAHVLHGGLDWFRRTEGHWAMLGTLADRAWRTRGFGDFWMHLLVAGGQADIALERDVQPWDIAAVACIVAEAGGRTTTWDGDPILEGGGVLTSNGRLHETAMAVLAGR